MPNSHDDAKGEPFSPFLFVPYYPADVGARPLPAGVPAWECASIKLDGQPISVRGPLVSGVSVGLSAVVANLGGVGSLVRVTFFWGDPATTFTAQTLHLIGTLTEYRTAGQTADTQTWPWIPPTNVPAHACLVVEVSTALDMAPGTFSPADRHYAQQNLTFVVLGAGGIARLPFRVANLGPKAGEVALRLRPMPYVVLKRLERRLRSTPTPLDPAAVRMTVDGEVSGPGPLRFTSGAGEVRLCEVQFQPAAPLPRDRFVAWVVEQTDPLNGDLILGALGVVVTARAR